MSDELLTVGNTVASLDEFYLFLSDLTAVEYTGAGGGRGLASGGRCEGGTVEKKPLLLERRAEYEQMSFL